MINQSIKQTITELLKLKQPKYVTRALIDKLYPGSYQQMIQQTSWLPDDVAPTHRMFCIVNDITDNIACRQCQKTFNRKLVKFTQDKQSYLDAFCSQRCQIDNREAIRAIDTANKRGLTPICATPGCNNHVKWQIGATEYSKHCSSKCAFRDAAVIQKRRETNIHKYGRENVLASDYGKRKIRSAMMTKFGVPYRRQNPDVIIQTMREGYSRITTRYPNVTPMFDFEEYRTSKGYNTPHYYPWKCNTCQHQFESRLSSSVTPKCPRCFPRNFSEPHRQISEFLTSLGIEHSNNDRSVIAPNEIDIWIPSHKLAIEFDGLYWHREQIVGKKYHLEKTQACESLGISLLHIFEDEWVSKQQIVESIIRSKLGLNQKIYARKTTVRPIDAKSKRAFMQQYHLQGIDRSEIALGLFDNEQQLIGVATFCKPRSVAVKTKFKQYYELSRMAFLPGITVVGGLSKLISHFKSMSIATGLYTFADRRYSNVTNNGYSKLMIWSHNTTPSYWYFTSECDRKWHRYNFAKHMLAGKLENFDPSLTEFDNMSAHGFSRIWDCGNGCYSLSFVD